MINIALSSNKCRVNKPWKNEQSYTYIVHLCFYIETQSARKPHNVFYYRSLRITFIGSTNFLCSLATTRRRLWPPIFSGYNLRQAPTPQLFGYKLKEDTIPYVLQIQPEGGYNHLSLPRPTTLKYKWNYETIVTLSLWDIPL